MLTLCTRESCIYDHYYYNYSLAAIVISIFFTDLLLIIFSISALVWQCSPFTKERKDLVQFHYPSSVPQNFLVILLLTFSAKGFTAAIIDCGGYSVVHSVWLAC